MKVALDIATVDNGLTTSCGDMLGAGLGFSQLMFWNAYHANLSAGAFEMRV